MKTDSQYNDYNQQLLDYAKFLTDEKLRQKGKFIEGVKPVYVVYARKSTKGKDRQERSIPDQIDDCQKMVKSLGIKPVKIFREKESAKISGKRSIFKEMIDGIKSGKYNSIVAWHPDRLARNMKDAGEIIDLLDRGIIVSLKFSEYTFVNDANGVMTLGIQFVLAKQYSDNLSAVSQRGSINIAKEGKSPTNKPKYGYLINEQRYFRPYGNNFNLLIDAFKQALERNPLEKIADYLNQNGFLFNGKRTKMTKQKLSNIFKDPFYAGIYAYGSELVDLKSVDFSFKPVVTPIDFLELRRILKDSNSFIRRRIKVLLFSKMVSCGYCNNLMSPGIPRSSGKSGYRYLTLRCNKNDCSSRFGKNIKRGLRGKVVFDYILNLLDCSLNVDKTAYDAYKKEAQQALLVNRQKCILKLKNINRQITEVDGSIGISTKALANAKSDNFIDELNQQIEKHRNEKQLLEAEKVKTQETILTIDHNVNSEGMSYENFLNFFKNIGSIVKNSNNQYLVDKIIRMVFLNFTVKNQKVVSHQLNPFFEQYVKLPSILDSRGWQI